MTLWTWCRFQEHDLEVVQLAFSTDERLLMTIGHEKDSKVFVLDTSTGKIVSRQVLPPRQRATACTFGPTQGSAYTFAAATQTGEVFIWSLDPFSGVTSAKSITTGSLRRTYTSLTFSPDGLWLYCGTTSGDIVTINVQRRAMQMTHPACGSGVGAMCFTSNGSRLLVGGGDGSLTLFTNDHMWRDITPFASIPGHITSVSPTSDGAALIIGTSNGTILRLPSGTTAFQTLRRAHAGPVRGIAILPNDPSTLASCSDDGTVSAWTLAMDTPPQPPGLMIQAGRSTDTKFPGAALSVAFNQAGIISGWADGAIRCHARGAANANQAPIWVIPEAHSLSNAVGVTAIKAAHRHPLIVSGGMGGELRAWDMRSRELVCNMKQHGAAIVDLCVLEDDSHIVAASQDKTWSLWDIHPGKSRATWRAGTVLNGIDVCPDQMTVVTAGQDRRVLLWDIRSPDVVKTLVSPTSDADPALTCVKVNPAGGAVAVGGADGCVTLWDLASGRQVGRGGAHTGPVSKIIFPIRADAAQQWQPMISSSTDGSIAYWQL